jgi:hypothetical protein
VLDCGGDIGDTTLAFAANGVPVTYVDFPGVCSEFARDRWRRFGCEDRVVALSPEDFWTKNDGSFGLIASFDVLEHLENPVRHAARYAGAAAAGREPGDHDLLPAQPAESGPPARERRVRPLFGGEKRTTRRCALTDLGLRRRRWYHFERD